MLAKYSYSMKQMKQTTDTTKHKNKQEYVHWFEGILLHWASNFKIILHTEMQVNF